jgi:hypothetical protein
MLAVIGLIVGIIVLAFIFVIIFGATRKKESKHWEGGGILSDKGSEIYFYRKNKY